MKVFELSDYEWWYGETLEAALAAAAAETGCSPEDYTADFTPIELTPEQMDMPNEVNIAGEGEPPEYVSFREALDLAMVRRGESGFLCGTEN